MRVAFHAALFAGFALLPGCVVVQSGVTNPIPEMRTVAVAPFVNLSAERSVDGRQFALAYHAELQKIPGYQVIPVGVTEQAILDLGLKLDGPEDAIKLAEALEADAVVIGAVTDYNPYYPPRIGLQVSWYAPEPIRFLPGIPTDPKLNQVVRAWRFAESHSHSRSTGVIKSIATKSDRTGKPLMNPVPLSLARGERGEGLPCRDALSLSASLSPEEERKRRSGVNPLPSPPAPLPREREGLLGRSKTDSRTIRAQSPDGATLTACAQDECADLSASSSTGTSPLAGPHLVPPAPAPSPQALQIVAGEMGAEATDEAMEREKASAIAGALAAPVMVTPEGGLMNGYCPPLAGGYPPPLSAGPHDPVKPVMSYTRIFDGSDAELTALLRDYVLLSGDLRSGGWEAYLHRTEDFMRFTAHRMIVEMLTLHGGESKRRYVWFLGHRRR